MQEQKETKLIAPDKCHKKCKDFLGKAANLNGDQESNKLKDENNSQHVSDRGEQRRQEKNQHIPKTKMFLRNQVFKK